MPKPNKGPRLGGGPAHERLLLANLAAALFTHKSITTTETKAKRLRPVAERFITFATMALQNGVDVKTVSSMLGHYSAGFTLDTYAHVTTDAQLKAAQTMGNILSGAL